MSVIIFIAVNETYIRAFHHKTTRDFFVCRVSYTDSNKCNIHGFLATNAERIKWQNLFLLVKFGFTFSPEAINYISKHHIF